MANFNLTGQKIKNTYGQVAQVNDSNKLVDGLGNEKQIVTSSIVNFPTEVSRSAAEAGFGAGGGATWPVSGTPSGIVSGAAQLPQIATNTADISSLTAATSSYLTSLPSGVVSSSAQVDLSLATGTAANATSASYASNASTADSATSSTTSVSASHAVYADSAGTAGSATTATSASHAVQADSALSANSATTATSASFAITASYALTAGSIAGLVTSASYAVTASHATNLTLQNGLLGSIQSVNIDGVIDATADGDGAVAIGDKAYALGIAIGGSTYGGEGGVAIGSGSRSASLRSVAIGAAALITGDSSVNISVGNPTVYSTGPQTINIGSGINNTGGYSTAIGHSITNTGTGGNVLIGRSITSANDYSIGIGEGVNVSLGGVAIGQNARSSGNSVAIGPGAIMGSSYGFAGGYNARANNDASIAVGGDVNVSSNQAIAIGTDTTIDGSSQGAVSFGQNADIATSTRAVVIGQGAGATGANNAVAIGSGSKVTAAEAINISDTWTYDGSERTTIDSVLNLPATEPLPTGQLGDIATSGSALYFHNGTSWAAIS